MELNKFLLRYSKHLFYRSKRRSFFGNAPADSCLLRMTELLPESHLLTLDSDFSIYRKHGREPVPVVMPEA
uniref:PIN domain-containing protein n=1 Tax=Candidatus Kentrum sp. FM TaxID=2126340 RepID=A0A450TVK9_9GAMM|nr:MAG: hypothetical protein BECKFM1743A_GA0114220_106805 [Candidatus Kentron sp. FM]VFJ72995.1 MAG: hypothetical protein BECKFM1743C_GA0114222_106915 [Candidatus Kentron sp. FM]VFK20449.1 MAG: hypothetical protein BECKFM1743B_GA0114221_106974 [Candidatus Kentron sp. FM]